MLESLNNTTFRELKHRGVPTPVLKSRFPMPVEITTFRVAFVHTNYKLTHNLRDLIYSSLMIYSLLKIFRIVCGFEKQPLLVTTLNHSSQKYRTNPRTDYKYIIIIINLSSIFILLAYEFILIYIQSMNYNKGELRCLKYLNK